MTKEPKPSVSEKLRIRTNRSEFNKLMKVANREADKGNDQIKTFSLKPLTRHLFLAEGFTIREEPYYEFTTYIISWKL